MSGCYGRLERFMVRHMHRLLIGDQFAAVLQQFLGLLQSN